MLTFDGKHQMLISLVGEIGTFATEYSHVGIKDNSSIWSIQIDEMMISMACVQLFTFRFISNYFQLYFSSHIIV